MGIFDDWASERKPFRIAVIAAALLALIVGLLSNFEKLKSYASKSQTLYDIQIEVHPVHFMYGRIAPPVIFKSDPAHPHSLESAARWVSLAIENLVVERGFGEQDRQIYELVIEGAELTLSNQSAGESAYLYSIYTDFDLNYESEYYGRPMAFRGVGDGRVPSYSQQLRILHQVRTDKSETVDLAEVFAPPVSSSGIEFPIVVDETGKPLNFKIFTFHGENGQFKGEIIAIYMTNDGFFFAGGKVRKKIDVSPRSARIALIEEARDTPTGFEAAIRSEIVESASMELPLNGISTWEDLDRLAARVRDLPLGEPREIFIDDNAVDFLISISLGGRVTESLFGIF